MVCTVSTDLNCLTIKNCIAGYLEEASRDEKFNKMDDICTCAWCGPIYLLPLTGNNKKATLFLFYFKPLCWYLS